MRGWNRISANRQSPVDGYAQYLPFKASNTRSPSLFSCKSFALPAINARLSADQARRESPIATDGISLDIRTGILTPTRDLAASTFPVENQYIDVQAFIARFAMSPGRRSGCVRLTRNDENASSESGLATLRRADRRRFYRRAEGKRAPRPIVRRQTQSSTGCVKRFLNNSHPATWSCRGGRACARSLRRHRP